MLLDEGLRGLVRERLRAFDVRAADRAAHRPAAVALALAEEGSGADLAGIAAPAAWSRQAAVLLTRRPQTLRNHAGQWALPGGRVDEGETPEAAALRELEEELGLRLPPAQVLGRLDDFVTRSGFVITPVVVWAGEANALVPSPHEVESVHRIPLAEFMRDDAPMLEATDDPQRPVLRMPVGSGWIAAPTAAILYQFREVCVAGRDTRVAHYDQPKFAWR
jgi:8-oxo-dGTP pyrophosphatase MutT (NUDIX family)